MTYSYYTLVFPQVKLTSSSSMICCYTLSLLKRMIKRHELNYTKFLSEWDHYCNQLLLLNLALHSYHHTSRRLDSSTQAVSQTHLSNRSRKFSMTIASNMIKTMMMQNVRLIDSKVQNTAWITAYFSTFTELMTFINLITNALSGSRSINSK